MNATASSNRRSYEQELAPHVEKQWAEAFIVELRLQGVSGKNLGAALAEVDSHCADADESARQTFGDPAAYAKSLQLPTDPANSPRATVIRLIPTAVQIIGFMTLIRASPSYVSGDPVAITAGDVGMFAILVGAVVVFAWQIRPLTNLVLRRPVVATAGLMAVMLVMLLPLVLWQNPIAEFAVLSAVSFGVVFLLVGTVWEVVRVRAEAAEEQISRPLDSSEELERRRRFELRMNYLRIFIFPVIAAVLIGATVLLS